MKKAFSQYQEIANSVPTHIKDEIDLEFAISNRIYDLLQKRGLSKVEFARAIGKRPCEVTKWISGQHNFTIRTIALLSNYFEEPIIKVC